MPSGLYLPTSRISNPLNDRALGKGELYNLDLDQLVGFQFNPTSLEWTRQFAWGEVRWQGDSSGGDLQYLSTGPRHVELSLLYMADPGSPDINYVAPLIISSPNNKFDFVALRQTLESWEQPLPGKKRPSRIRIIFGENSFDCVITSSTFRITTFFEDLSAREAVYTAEFREWLPLEQ